MFCLNASVSLIYKIIAAEDENCQCLKKERDIERKYGEKDKSLNREFLENIFLKIVNKHFYCRYFVQ